MLDYKSLFVELTPKDLPGEREELILYSKSDDSFKIYKQTEDSDEITNFLAGISEKHSVGTMNTFKKYILLCIGPENDSKLRFNVWKAAASIRSKKILVVEGEYANDIVYSMIIKSYSYKFLKKSANEENTDKIKIQAPDSLKSAALANAQNFARFLGDTPGNYLTPLVFADYIKDYFSSSQKINLDVLKKDFLINQKVGLVLSVAQGSINEPVLLHAKYFGRDSSNIDLALVGKGVTFDTGGISLKGANEMYKLKQDMMGAAILSSLLKLISDFGMKINVSLTLPLVENMPGSSATKPGDVFVSLSGKTVEVDNTDAEGRLILADAITFAQRDSPKYLLDVATLTGSVRIALGNVFGAYFTENDDLSKKIDQCSIESSDYLWRMPLSVFFLDGLKTDVADLCNVNRKMRGGGASAAASFLKEFVDEKTVWAHFDVSGIRNNHFLKGIFGDQTTGRPLPTFLKLAEEIEKECQ